MVLYSLMSSWSCSLTRVNAILIWICLLTWKPKVLMTIFHVMDLQTVTVLCVFLDAVDTSSWIITQGLCGKEQTLKIFKRLASCTKPLLELLGDTISACTVFTWEASEGSHPVAALKTPVDRGDWVGIFGVKTCPSLPQSFTSLKLIPNCWTLFLFYWVSFLE